MFRNGVDTTAAVKRAKGHGLKVDQSFGRALHGFAAKLDKKQEHDLKADPNVLAVVPDGVIQLAQTIPTGVSRVGGQVSDVADIDGSDQRVDADVAIVDTGIAQVPDLNVAGGYNCSSADRTAWRDRNDHGTHVAGTVAALDNSFGVVGVAPGARVWAVKILNDSGYGLISWYVCGLDWILAQRDPNDASRPLFEAVNMSVTKAGADDGNCGLTNHDPLHQAICRVVAGGITVVAAAANDSHSATPNIPASYNEVITVSALADTDGRPGGLGGNRCFSWGGYDKDDTFADFSNYGFDVDIIAPGKCILSTIPGPAYAYMSGTSMAAPTVTGAVALYKASRPNATPAEVRESLRYLGNLNWKTSTDPDSTHEPLLDVSRIGSLGTFALTPGRRAHPSSRATRRCRSRSRSPAARRSSSVSGCRSRALPPAGPAPPVPSSLMGWTATAARVSVTVPKGTPAGHLQIGVRGTNQGRTVVSNLPVTVVNDVPTANAPFRPSAGRHDGARPPPSPRVVAGGHRPVQPDRRATRCSAAATAARGPARSTRPAPSETTCTLALVRHHLSVPRPGASTRPATGARGRGADDDPRATRSTTAARRSAARGSWIGRQQRRARTSRRVIGSTQARRPTSLTFTGTRRGRRRTDGPEPRHGQGLHRRRLHQRRST